MVQGRNVLRKIRSRERMFQGGSGTGKMQVASCETVSGYFAS